MISWVAKLPVYYFNASLNAFQSKAAPGSLLPLPLPRT